MPYLGVSPSNGVRRVFDYTATAGQTSFSGSDNNSQTLAYTDSAYVDVFQNGVLLVPSDYTATTGTSVVLDTGATVSDSVQIVVFDVFSVADTVSASDGGSFGGNVGIGGTLNVTGIGTFSDDIIIGDGKTIGSTSDVDAMTISSGGVVTFSQTPSGTQTYTPLLNVDNISDVSTYAVNNTYINSTYDYYFVSAFFKPATDGVTLYQRLYISASQDNGALTQGSVAPNSWEYAQIGGTNTSGGDNTGAGATLHFTTIGNGTGEGIHFHNHYYANNEKANTIYWHGQSSHHATNGAHVGSVTSGASGTPASLYQYSLVGMDFYFSSGNISTGRINVYGVKGYV
jgi:hypothetical protein